MLFSRFLSRFVPLFGVLALLSAPSFAAEFTVFPDSSTQVGSRTQAGKGKKGDAPPRPRPKPGPQEGGDDD